MSFIVGPSGSGKSTLASLIANVRQPLLGDISIDGNSTSVLDSRWISEHISLVRPQSALFDETVFRNISFGRADFENVTSVDVTEACKMAALDHDGAPETLGLDSTVGLGGKLISGGQLQRVGDSFCLVSNSLLTIFHEDCACKRTATGSRHSDFG